jgi:hypothetical protein
MNQAMMTKLLLVAAVFLLAVSANADRDGRRGERDDVRHDNFRKHRDIRQFDRHDYGLWRSGSWHRVRHDGKLGWWWVVAGTWYFYHQPVYPFPDPYTPPVILIQPPPADTQNNMPPPAQFWYFCTSANNYYPYIASCPEGWKSVPATPAAPAPALTPATPAK